MASSATRVMKLASTGGKPVSAARAVCEASFSGSCQTSSFSCPTLSFQDSSTFFSLSAMGTLPEITVSLSVDNLI